MEAEKITNLLNDSSNEGYKFAKTMVFYRQSNSKKINTAKIILLSLGQKVLNQVFVIFVIILMDVF